MRYSDDIIEEVRQKNDIVDVVSQYVKLTRKGSSYFGLCPFHNEKTPSFSVTPGKQMYYCFGCGAGGNVFNFIMEYENYTFGEALKHLADRAGVELPKIEYSREVREKVQERTELLEINTLENAIYMSMKNDLSFLIDARLSLYEHQSTYNPNMPLRDLFYISSEYQKMVDWKSLYTSTRLRIPTPNFIVFYNGTEKKKIGG